LLTSTNRSEVTLEPYSVEQTRWTLVLAIVLALFLCCCIVVCSLLGFVWWGAYQYESSMAGSTVSHVIVPTISEVPSFVPEPEGRQPTAAEHQTARMLAQTTIPQRDLFDLAVRLQGLSPAELQTATTPIANYSLGDSKVFWLHRVQSNTYYTTTATLAYETPHAYWWIENGHSVDPRGLEESAERFEELTYPTNQRHFGTEWSPGIDADPHVYIFLGSVPGVGGYYSGPDEYPKTIRDRSNEHEIFYINLQNAQPGTSYFDGILAHEHQHMIHWAEDRDEDSWINEGLSELAGLLNGYDVGQTDLEFSLQPDTQLTTWPELKDSAANYGASYLFLTYFFEQFGEQAIRALVAEPANGPSGFETVLAGDSIRFQDAHPGNSRFDALFGDWVIANYLDDPRLAGGRYGYKKLNLTQPWHAAYHLAYPVEERATVHQYATDYILLEGEGDLEVSFQGSSVVPLIGNDAHQGQRQWWSNRGDEADATLTRAFDLAGLETATLQTWMWYDLEKDFDYAYVQVSPDEGQTWHLLSNQHTTTANPHGNSYGPGFTGTSGNDRAAQWVEETFDLTPFAGGPILLRFEVITDEALNRPGVSLDGISIPEMGYSHDVEHGLDGWQAEGWVPITGHVPQEFLVQLITVGREIRVEPMLLDTQNRGTLSIVGLGRDIDQAVLVISALAPATTESATYSYQITTE
jgi:hypothetical protein